MGSVTLRMGSGQETDPCHGPQDMWPLPLFPPQLSVHEPSHRPTLRQLPWGCMGGRQWDFRYKLGLHVVVDSMNTYTLVVDSMSRHWLDWAWRMPGVEGGASLGRQVQRV